MKKIRRDIVMELEGLKKEHTEREAQIKKSEDKNSKLEENYMDA